MTPDGPIRQILDLARWAPSGDNTQPWRFEYIDDQHIVLHGFDTRDHCVYDLDGRPSQLSLGALIETIAMAATTQGLSARFTRRSDAPDITPTFDIEFVRDTAIAPHPLVSSITVRCVQRRALTTRRLTSAEKARVEAAAGPGHTVLWLEGLEARWRAARLMFRNAKLRLTMPEAYEVHKSVIEWGAAFSEDRMPDQALGASAMTLKSMRWVLQSWDRVRFVNRYLAGTWSPRIEMDLIPALACAAHMVILAPREPLTIDGYIDAGRAVQRVWLTLTQLGLHQQPEMTPLIFDRYVRQGIRFTGQQEVADGAARLSRELAGVIGTDPSRAVWIGRVGAGTAAHSRSTRLPLSRLEWTGSANADDPEAAR